MCQEGEFSVFEAEARGVLEAIKWVMELGTENVMIECDSMLTLQTICKDTENLLEAGNLLQESRSLIRVARTFLSRLFY